MFSLPEDRQQRIEQALAQRICTAEDGSYIRRSYGQGRAGRPARYSVHMADGAPFTVRAYDDQAAVALANRRITQRKDKEGKETKR